MNKRCKTAETHPFGSFVPSNSKHLFLGSFTGKNVSGYDWFYSNGRNQFWPILEEVFSRKFPTRPEKQKLFAELNMAITDIILSCERMNRSNLDTNLTNIVLNTEAIVKVLEQNNIGTIFFSSQFAEKLFKKYFKTSIASYPNIKFITLPSPSPRYAAMSKSQKVKKYKELLPKLKR